MMGWLGSKLRALEGGRIAFWCPGCDGVHQVAIGSGPGPRWGFNGNGDRPTLEPSVLVNAPGPYHHPAFPTCHSFVIDGRIKFLGDCTHELAGQTVELPNFEV